MAQNHRIIVSAENSPYMAWQCKLFYFSCVTRLDHQPAFIVHENGDDWDPGFRDLVRAGAIVRKAPSYLCDKRLITRNTVGTLIHAAKLLAPDEFIVLCDPDMIFARNVEFPRQLTGNYYDYLHYEQDHIVQAAEKLGLTRETLLRKEDQIRCGVPYVIPAGQAARLGNMWLKAMDCFSIADRHWDSIWLDVMYAFGLAITKLEWNISRVDVVDMDEALDTPVRRPILHYCLGDAGWDKRWYRPDEKAAEVWDSPYQTQPNTVLHEIFSQIVQAREFYRGSYVEAESAKARYRA